MIRLATPCIWTIVCTKGKKKSIFTFWFVSYRFKMCCFCQSFTYSAQKFVCFKPQFACFLNDICIMSGLSVSISACLFFVFLFF